MRSNSDFLSEKNRNRSCPPQQNGGPHSCKRVNQATQTHLSKSLEYSALNRTAAVMETLSQPTLRTFPDGRAQIAACVCESSMPRGVLLETAIQRGIGSARTGSHMQHWQDVGRSVCW